MNLRVRRVTGAEASWIKEERGAGFRSQHRRHPVLVAATFAAINASIGLS